MSCEQLCNVRSMINGWAIILLSRLLILTPISDSRRHSMLSYRAATICKISSMCCSALSTSSYIRSSSRRGPYRFASLTLFSSTSDNSERSGGKKAKAGATTVDASKAPKRAARTKLIKVSEITEVAARWLLVTLYWLLLQSSITATTKTFFDS